MKNRTIIFAVIAAVLSLAASVWADPAPAMHSLIMTRQIFRTQAFARSPFVSRQLMHGQLMVPRDLAQEPRVLTMQPFFSPRFRSEQEWVLPADNEIIDTPRVRLGAQFDEATEVPVLLPPDMGPRPFMHGGQTGISSGNRMRSSRQSEGAGERGASNGRF